MRVFFTFGGQPGEILDLTAPACDQDGIVARWLRDALARDESEPAYRMGRDVQRAAV